MHNVRHSRETMNTLPFTIRMPLILRLLGSAWVIGFSVFFVYILRTSVLAGNVLIWLVISFVVLVAVLCLSQFGAAGTVPPSLRLKFLELAGSPLLSGASSLGSQTMLSSQQGQSG